MKELNDQRAFMEHSVRALQRKAKLSEANMRRSKATSVTQNTVLISDMNDLRKERTLLQRKCAELEKSLSNAKKLASKAMAEAARPQVAAASVAEGGRAGSVAGTVRRGRPAANLRQAIGRSASLPQFGK